jgi:hypothetical protein
MEGKEWERGTRVCDLWWRWLSQCGRELYEASGMARWTGVMIGLRAGGAGGYAW